MTLNTRRVPLLLVLPLAAAVFLTASAGILLTAQDSRIASIWLSNAITLVVLLRARRQHWGWVLATSYLANCAADLVAQDTLARAAALSAINIVEVTVAAIVMRWRGADIDIRDLASLRRFSLAVVLAPAVSATLAVGYFALTSVLPASVEVWLHWFTADSLGLLMLVPLLLAVPRSIESWRPSGQTALFLVAAAGLMAIIFSQPLSLLFLALPLLTLAAFRLSIGATALVVLVSGGIAIGFTLAGSGPIAASTLGPGAQMFVLQAYVVAMVAVTLPVGVIIAQRDRLVGKLLDSERERREAAEALALSKSEFLATMSHEIRTPMTGVLGMVDLLQDDPDPVERARLLETLKRSGTMLMSVLDDVLDLSKIESGRLLLDEQDFDLRQLAETAVALFGNSASRKSILLKLDIEKGEPAWVRSDPVRLQQIISNLVSNAVKFTDRGKVVLALAARASEQGPEWRRWRIEVRDSGCGIPQSELKRLFQPFFQARSAGSTSHGGTGLGLAISSRLVALLGGQMGVDSRPGAGSTFWVELDLPDAVPPAATSHAGRAAPAPCPPLDILVAEDNAVNRMLIDALLRRLGHSVTCVANGRLAVEAARARRYDCVLMDMQMPELDGLAATRQIRASGGPCADVPIIALTADAAPERRRFYDNAGLTDFLTKPIDSALLEQRLVEAARPRPPFDPDQLGDLRRVLSKEQLHALLIMLADELRKRPAAIRAALAAGDAERARSEAHSLKGAALNVGAVLVGDAAFSIERAFSAPLAAKAINPPALDRLDRLARATLDALAPLVRDSSAPSRLKR